MSKFLLNALIKFLRVLPNFKFHQNSKIYFAFGSSLGFGPTGPPPPQTIASPLGPTTPTCLVVFTKRRLLFGFVHSNSDSSLSLLCHCHAGHAC
jgi:hypothetical protein